MNGPPRMPRVIQVPSQIPLLGGDKPTQEQIEAAQKQHAQDLLDAKMQGLSMGIYAQLASSNVTMKVDGFEPTADQLRQIAQYAQTAARCYFEGIGVIQQEGKTE